MQRISKSSLVTGEYTIGVAKAVRHNASMVFNAAS